MRALALAAPGATASEGALRLRLVERPTPQPARGEVLIRVEAAPCNPSDLGFLSGSYSIERPLPAVPGFECSGVVVASGGGLFAALLRGRRVATGGQGSGDGTWAEYYVAQAQRCVPLLPGVDFEQGSSLLVNPMTALGLLYRARLHGSRAIIQNAAASQLAGMIRALSAERRIPVINIVRRPEQADSVRKSGVTHVLDSTAPGFHQELSALAAELNATTAFDAVGGALTGELLASIPSGGQVIAYGGLSGENPSHLDSTDIVFRGKSVTGFHLGRHVEEIGMRATLADALRVQRAVRRGAIRLDVRVRVGLAEAPAAISAYALSMSEGKVLILPRR